MPKLNEWGVYGNFKDASNIARAIAFRYGVNIGVTSCSGHWSVLVPEDVKQRLDIEHMPASDEDVCAYDYEC